MQLLHVSFTTLVYANGKINTETPGYESYKRCFVQKYNWDHWAQVP